MRPNRRHVVKALAAGPFIAAAPWVSARAQGLQKLSLICGTFPPDPACHFLYYARDKGFYKDAGIDIEITGVASATNATRAVVGGVADVGWVDGSSPILARDSGARIRAISGFSSRLDYQIVGIKDLKSMKDLAGRRFGVATIGGGTFVIPRLMIERAGGDPDRVQWVAIGNSAARIQAMIVGTIDATITTTSFIPRVLSYPQFHSFGDAGKELPNMIYAVEIANERALADKRATIVQFIAATSRAVRWAAANPDEAVALSMALLPDAPKDEISGGIRAYIKQGFWSAEGTMSKEQIDFTVAALLKSGQIKKPVSYEEFVVAGLAK